MQAIAVCESGALEAYGVTEQELAVMCASHNGEPAYGDEAVSAAKRLSIRREGGAYGNEKAEHTVMEKRDI